MRAAELQRVGRIAAEIEKRAAILLIGGAGSVGHVLEIVDLALEVDFVARPGLTQDFHDLVAAAAVTKRAVGDFAGKSEEMTLSVSRPFSMWSSVATVRASMIGCISPQRMAASMLIFSVIGAQAATKESVSCPT